MNRPGEAFENSEFTKARVFAEALSNRSRNSGSHIPKDIVERDSRLNEQLAALKKKLQSAYEKQDTEATAALEPQLKELNANGRLTFQASDRTIRYSQPQNILNRWLCTRQL